MATTRIQCQFTGCDYVAEHNSEPVAIAMFTSHNNVHTRTGAVPREATKQKVPKIDRPELKQDINDEEWQSFQAEWRRFKRCTEIAADEMADQLFQCCEQPLRRLLLKENPDIIEAGEQQLMNAMKKMAVLHVATTVRRTNLMSLKQDHGQTFREYYANVRAAAATCEYKAKCPHECCAAKDLVDYTPMVVKDILIAGIEDNEIRKDVLGMSELDSKSDKEIVEFVEEKEIARNALQTSLSTNAVSSYNKNRKAGESSADSAAKKKLAMRGKCPTCSLDYALYKQYPNGKMNKDPFKVCRGCFVTEKSKTQEEKSKQANVSETGAVLSFIASLDMSSETSEIACAEDSHGGSEAPVLESARHEPISVNISLQTSAHFKFGRDMNSVNSRSTIEAAASWNREQCAIGTDVFQKLNCPRSVLLKAHNSADGLIGRAFVRLEYAGRCAVRMVDVIDSLTGIHLDEQTLLGLAQGQDVTIDGEVLAAESHFILDHHVFTPTGWSKLSTLRHPRLRVRVTTSQDDYDRMDLRYPKIAPKHIDVVTDSGAQSCLWSRKECLASGFSMEDIVPVRHSMRAANRAPIRIDGAIFLRLTGESADGDQCEAAVMVYISPDANSFFLSKDAMIQLGVIAPSFPQIGAHPVSVPTSVAASEVLQPGSQRARSDDTIAPCGCRVRALPPGKPDRLPFDCTFENVDRMKEFLLERYGHSSFNQCPHQLLPSMDGPPIALHVKEGARPVRVTTPSPVPIHFQEKVKNDLDADEKMDVLEKVPYGETPEWISRMVITRKHDGEPRRCIDYTALNKQCERETHPSKSPFHLARSVPSGSIKTVLDAWNGFHSVPISEEDRHYTSFITPWGLYRYKRAPQGFLSSGDGYNRRFSDILANLERLVRCVDDSLLYDDNLEEHWWRVIEFLEVAGNAGVVLNPKKFQFSKETVDFAGFRITKDTVEPLPKYLDAIREYPTPENITDIRSWFGLVNQVAHYAQLRDHMEPFKKFLSPKTKFEWTDELDTLFNESKDRIVEAIREGVKIFDLTKRTALMSDWSKTGVGFWLLQQHCGCAKQSPGCCPDGWKITLAGSRFLSSAERNYAPVEGEALGVAWALEHSRYFTMGCNDLLVVVDHKPLVKLLGNRRLDEIVNPRLFRIKQRTLMWRFQIKYQPGVQNYVADAVSRRPNKHAEMDDRMEEMLVAGIANDLDKFYAITWEGVNSESRNDHSIGMLVNLITTGFPSSVGEMPPEIVQYWDYRHGLYVTDNVVLYNDRIVVPEALRERVLLNLHSAHQGITSMTSRALATVFWPGITASIEKARNSCRTCHRNAPSQAKLPPTETKIPKAPFERICADYFKLGGNDYLVIVDRLSGWAEVVQVKTGNGPSGARRLCQALLQIFATFGAPKEISSDGGPEFTAKETQDLFDRWGIKHRLSSAYFPQSNGRAELAVKATKRLLEDNVGLNGELNTDKVVCALLQQRNTPDRDCSLSPAQIIFGRSLRDGIPQLDKSKMIHDNEQVCSQWRESWAAKEAALRSRLVKNCEKLEANSKSLPPLREGDTVLIQNQGTSPRRPTKWDRQGKIVATGEHDQYLVRVTGSGRVTLRNRRFLRRFEEAGAAATTPLSRPVTSSTGIKDSEPSASESRVPDKRADRTLPESDAADARRRNSENQPLQGVTEEHPSAANEAHVVPTYDEPPHNMLADPCQASPSQPDDVSRSSGPPRRSARNRTQQKLYDASSGTWK